MRQELSMVRSRVVHRGWMVGGRGVVGGWWGWASGDGGGGSGQGSEDGSLEHLGEVLGGWGLRCGKRGWLFLNCSKNVN